MNVLFNHVAQMSIVLFEDWYTLTDLEHFVHISYEGSNHVLDISAMKHGAGIRYCLHKFCLKIEIYNENFTLLLNLNDILWNYVNQAFAIFDTMWFLLLSKRIFTGGPIWILCKTFVSNLKCHFYDVTDTSYYLLLQHDNKMQS